MKHEPPEFPFDFWARLAREDPTAFEEARKLMLDSLIEAAPLQVQPRLKGLQWQIERIRSKSATPLGACLKISDLMWANVLGEGGLAAQLESLGDRKSVSQAPRRDANVLAFRPRSEPR